MMTAPKLDTATAKYRSSYFSPAQCWAYYHVPYQFREIQIHWWNAPSAKPTHQGIVNMKQNDRDSSVNYVASGGRVTKLVSENNCALTTQNGNPYGVKIECSPYGTDKDYETFGWLVWQIWERHGKKKYKLFGPKRLPLTPHKKYWTTACPGTLSLSRIEQEAIKWQKTEDEEMLTTNLYNIMRRFYLGAPPTKAQIKRNVGKVSAESMAKSLAKSAKYTAEVAKAKAGTMDTKAHLPAKIRAVFKG